MKNPGVNLFYTDVSSSGRDEDAWFSNPVFFAKTGAGGDVVVRKITGVMSGVFVTETMGGETFGSREECEAVFSFRNVPVMFLSRYNEMSPDDPEVLGFILRNNPGLRAEDCL